MGWNTHIGYVHASFNGWFGCDPVSAGCHRCFAESWAKHFGKDFSNRQRTKDWSGPRKWDRAAAKAGSRYRVLCNTLADVFDNQVPVAWRQDLFELIRATPNLDWMLLTKRIGNVRPMLVECGPWPDNAWLGVTVCNQSEADRDLPRAIAVKRALHIPCLFVSVEPLLGPVTMASLPAGAHFLELGADAADASINGLALEIDGAPCAIDWIIPGGESGVNARPLNPSWIESLVIEAEAHDKPVFFKQWGEWSPECTCKRECKSVARPGPGQEGRMWLCGVKAAGNRLNGRLYEQVPTVVTRVRT